MKFIVFQCSESPEYFVVTDTDHVADVKKSSSLDGGGLREVGEYAELEAARMAFDQSLAMSSIANKGYYCFEAPSMAAAPPSPEMP